MIHKAEQGQPKTPNQTPQPNQDQGNDQNTESV